MILNLCFYEKILLLTLKHSSCLDQCPNIFSDVLECLGVTFVMWGNFNFHCNCVL